VTSPSMCDLKKKESDNQNSLEGKGKKRGWNLSWGNLWGNRSTIKVTVRAEKFLAPCS